MTTIEARLPALGYHGVSAPTLVRLGRAEARAEAARLGTAAFARARQEGRSIAPAQDAEMGKLIKRQQGDTDGVIALLDAFNKAYHAANQAQSVEPDPDLGPNIDTPKRTPPAQLPWAQEGVRLLKQDTTKNLRLALARLDTLQLQLRDVEEGDVDPGALTDPQVMQIRDVLAAGTVLDEALRSVVPVKLMETHTDAKQLLMIWARRAKAIRELLREVKLLQDGKRSVQERLDGMPG